MKKRPTEEEKESSEVIWKAVNKNWGTTNNIQTNNQLKKTAKKSQYEIVIRKSLNHKVVKQNSQTEVS